LRLVGAVALSARQTYGILSITTIISARSYLLMLASGDSDSGGGGSSDSGSSSSQVTNTAGDPYPTVTDLKTGQPIPMPDSLVQGTTQRVPPAQRVTWNMMERGAFIREWYNRGFPDPPGSWADYDIHHILPREFGGTNVFENLTPVERSVHQSQFTAWWNRY